MIQSQIVSLLFVLLAGCSTEPSPLTGVYQPADCSVLAVKPDVGKMEKSSGHIAQPVKKLEIDEAKPTDKINLNTATETELEELPGVGPALAKRIIDYRTKRTFKRITDIRRVKGIGRAKFKKMESMISVK